MNIQTITADKEKAKNLLCHAEEFLYSLKRLGNGKVSFLLKEEYDILHMLGSAILAFDGEKINGQDHHKILVSRIAEKYKKKITASQANNWNELRKIRNDINYYGQKDKVTLQDFYDRNKESIASLREILFTIIKDKFTSEKK